MWKRGDPYTPLRSSKAIAGTSCDEQTAASASGREAPSRKEKAERAWSSTYCMVSHTSLRQTIAQKRDHETRDTTPTRCRYGASTPIHHASIGLHCSTTGRCHATALRNLRPAIWPRRMPSSLAARRLALLLRLAASGVIERAAPGQAGLRPRDTRDPLRRGPPDRYPPAGR